MTAPDTLPTPRTPVAAPPVKKSRRKWPWIVGGVVALLFIISIANSGNPQPDPGNPANGGVADLWMTYDAQTPPQGLPRSILDPSAKDACIAIAKATNPLPGEKEKYASYVTVQSFQSAENTGALSAQPFVTRLAQAQAVVAAAEKVYCPGGASH
jgi:hypothetical protein